MSDESRTALKLGRLPDIERSRIEREIRHAWNTRWPAGDSWIRGYAEDCQKLLVWRKQPREAIEKAIEEERQRGASDALVGHIDRANVELARARGIQRAILDRQVRPPDAERFAAIAACPTPMYHETHRYCPSCPWTEADG